MYWTFVRRRRIDALCSNTHACKSILECTIAPSYLAPCDSHICAHRVILRFWNINGTVSFWVVSKLSSSIGNTFFFKSWFLFRYKLNLKKFKQQKITFLCSTHWKHSIHVFTKYFCSTLGIFQKRFHSQNLPSKSHLYAIVFGQ